MTANTYLALTLSQVLAVCFQTEHLYICRVFLSCLDLSRKLWLHVFFSDLEVFEIKLLQT